jgi:hypothetical protein
MINTRNCGITILLALFLIPLGYAQDLSSYRDYHLGMNLAAVAERAKLQVSDARLICLRPAMIQELEWQSPRAFDSSPRADPVKGIIFNFYDGELFRILVSYYHVRAEGLTDEDLIESISARHGAPTTTAGNISIYSTSHLYIPDEKVIARWEDSRYSVNLFRLSSKATLGMLIFSKRLELLARVAMTESSRLDGQEVPGRGIELSMPHGDFVLQTGDEVVAVVHPDHAAELACLLGEPQ